MSATLQILHWLAGFITLAEALNKLERTTPFARGLNPHTRLVAFLKALAWALLASGAAAAVALPVLAALGMPLFNGPVVLRPVPTFAETAVLCGFAVLIIRTRFKEG